MAASRQYPVALTKHERRRFQGQGQSQGQRARQDEMTPRRSPDVVPEAERAEQALLSLALDDGPGIRIPAIREVLRIQVEKFKSHQHRAVARVIHQRAAQGLDSDYTTVYEDLNDAGYIGDSFECAFRNEYAFDAVYHDPHLIAHLDPINYAAQIHRAYQRRLTMKHAQSLAQIALDGQPGELEASLPIIANELSQAAREASPVRLMRPFAPVDWDTWLEQPRARLLDPEMNWRAGQTALLYAKANTGKSLYAQYRLGLLAVGALTGQPEHVAYFCGEGQSGMPGRIKAMLLYHGLDAEVFKEHFHLILNVPKLARPESVAEAIEEMHALDVPLTAFAIDTLTAAMPGMNHDSSEVMSLAMDVLKDMQAASGATPFILHHPGKDETRGPRGSAVVRDAADITILASQSDNGVITFQFDKSRDGSRERTWAYRIVQQGLEGDQWVDDPQPVLQPATPCAKPMLTKRMPLSPTQQQVWKILDDAGGLRWTAWLTACEDQGLNRDTAKSAMFKLREVSRAAKDDVTGIWHAFPDQAAKGETG